MPKHLVVAIEASLIGYGAGLPLALAKLNQSSDSEAAANGCVIAAWSVASLASETFDVISRFELEEPAHLRFCKITRNVGVTRVAIYAADVSRPGKVANIVSRSRNVGMGA